MTKQIKALKLALEALEIGLCYAENEDFDNRQKFRGHEHLMPTDAAESIQQIKVSIAAIREALSEPQHKCPVCGHEQTDAVVHCGNCGNVYEVVHQEPEQPAQQTDQSVMPEYLEWLESIKPRHGVGGNEAWNAGVEWVLRQRRCSPEKEAQINTALGIEQPVQQHEPGWKLVPAEATQAMYAAWMTSDGPWSERYLELLNAAPQPAQQECSHEERMPMLVCVKCGALCGAIGQQEPLFWYRPRSDGMYECLIHNAQIKRARKESGGWHPLYTSPPQRKPWVGLTEDDVIAAMCADGCERIECFYLSGPVQKAAILSFADAIEAKLKEKNA